MVNFDSVKTLVQYDKNHIWHPYSSINSDSPLYVVESASGVRIKLKDGPDLIDGMSSWWSTIHGYNHPHLNRALNAQSKKMSHVMFGGLTHEPAVSLASRLVDMTPPGLEKVFFSDSGSVAVEVAIKMAHQYWISSGHPEKNKLLALRSGYHGDTFAAMSVCDPVTGMHSIFSQVLQEQIFAESPQSPYLDDWQNNWNPDSIIDIKNKITTHHKELSAVILEPIVQGAGGMNFYSPKYLQEVRNLCDQYNLLLIADEIATGFGRTGKLFACNHAGISPDILCLGKALTGGYLSFAATLCSNKIADGICNGEAGVFMHGPTFMGNPLACAVANASLDLLDENNWQSQVKNIENQLKAELQPCAQLDNVKDVRVLGAIGVVELHNDVVLSDIQPRLVEKGVWLRPFGSRVYMMPPYIIGSEDLSRLTSATRQVIENLNSESEK